MFIMFLPQLSRSFYESLAQDNGVFIVAGGKAISYKIPQMHEFLEKVVEQARLQMNLDTDRFGGNLNRGNIGTFLDTMVAYAEEGGLGEEECKVCIVLPPQRHSH